MYERIYGICQNVEKVMEMFSEELKILDKNTVRLMIDEMQEEIEEQGIRLKEKDAQLEQKDSQLKQKDKLIEELRTQLTQQSDK